MFPRRRGHLLLAPNFGRARNRRESADSAIIPKWGLPHTGLGEVDARAKPLGTTGSATDRVCIAKLTAVMMPSR